MEKHVENFLDKISIAVIAISTLLLLLLLLRTPQTCVPPNTPINKPHLKFPSSTCDQSLNRPYLSSVKKNQRLWSSRSWLTKLSSFKVFFSNFQNLNLLHNHSRVLCVSAGAGHEVMALNQLGVADVTGVELVDSLPLVSKADPTNLPFFDGVFDFAFTAHLTEALFPVRFAGEMERTVRRNGACVVVVDQCGEKEVGEIVAFFRNSEFIGAQNVSLIGEKITSIVLRVGVSSTS